MSGKGGHICSCCGNRFCAGESVVGRARILLVQQRAVYIYIPCCSGFGFRLVGLAVDWSWTMYAATLLCWKCQSNYRICARSSGR